MMVTEQGISKERLMDLERTVEALNGRLRDMQWELQQVRGQSLTERLWKNFMTSRQGSAFMSTVCNRRIRPNTKVLDHVGTTGY
ncbi:hypothetical protein [Petrachloros mirabilis]